MISHFLSAAEQTARFRRTVLLALAVTFLAVVAVRLISLWTQYNEAIAAGRERAQHHALVIGDHFARSVALTDGSLIQISSIVTRLRSDAKFADDLTPLLQQSLKTLQGVGSLTVTDANGTVTHSTIPQIVGESRKDRLAFQRLQANPDIPFVADAPYRSRLTNRLLIPLARRIDSADGGFAGVVVATLEPEQLREFYKAFEIGKKGVIWLVHPEGFVLIREPDGHMVGSRLPAEHPLLTANAPRDGRGTDTIHVAMDGDHFITAIQQYTNLGVRVAVSISEQELLKDWWRDARNSLIVIFATGLALGFAAYQISRQMKERIAETEKFLTTSRQFQEILDHAPATITVKNREGRIILANREFQRRIRKTPEQMTGLRLKDLLPEHYANEISAIDEEVIRTGKMIQREVTSPEPRCYLATKFPLFDAAGNVEAVGSISQDITEAKAAQTINLRIFEKSLDLILVTDSKGRLIRVSPSVYPILGYRPEEIEGRNAIELIHPADLHTTREEMRQARKGLISRDFQTRYLHKDGRAVDLNWTGMWVEEEQQHFFIGHDMTERTKLEAELHQSQKMEAIGQLTGGLAHDYNNLLTVILGNAELLVEALHGNAALTPMAQSVLDAANRSAVLTQRLLAFGRRQALESEPIDVSALVQEMTDLVRFTAGEGVRLDFALDTDPWIVSIDRNQFETAVLNLVVNARDAMRGRGVLRIETAKAEFGESASIVPDMKDGNYMMLAVTDNGSGMSQEVLSRVFEPFFTTKDVGKGTGLGLSMVYGFVKQSGGHVAIYSEPGHGTAVKLFFPTTDRRIADDYNSDRRDKAADLPMGTESILVVEDDALVRENTQRQLLSLGYRVLVVGNGREALRQLSVGYRPDLLLTDVILGGEMNGKELADKVRVIDPGIRVMFMSGYTSGVLADPVTGVIPESMNFIGKPFRRSQLARSVRDALESGTTCPHKKSGPLSRP